MKLIYENDIPSRDSIDFCLNDLGWTMRRLSRRIEDEKRWKTKADPSWENIYANGITDNREEWRKKHIELLKKDLAYKAKRCLDVLNMYCDIAEKTKEVLQKINP